MALLEARDLLCVRGERMVFAALGLALDAGEALVLSGPNGSGKSSLLRLLAGLLRPAAGSILWQGRAIAEEPELHRARLAYVGHQDPVKPVLSVRENLVFWTRLKGGDAAAVPQALERFGLGSLAEVPGRMLSAGERRRLNLARLLAAPAPLWLLDEPTVGLDIASRQFLLDHVRRLCREEGLAVLWATHLIDEVDPEGRVIVLHRGRILAQGVVGEVIREAGASTMRAAFDALTKGAAS